MNSQLSQRVLVCVCVLGVLPTAAFRQQTALTGYWETLSRQVEGRLYENVPFARSCFSQSDSGALGSYNVTACAKIQEEYGDELKRTASPSAFINTQWETCQATSEQCLLDYKAPWNTKPTLPPNTCSRGSISEYYIDVRKPEDVAAAFQFSRDTKIPLVIKNTGHDYKGRSSSPHSLSLWTHNLKDITYHPEFVPSGCSKSSPGVTIGAGAQWGEVYSFAEAHNITIVGGSDQAVGAVGGWLQGGGHSALSNTMGLGVDRVLEFKIVTPDGEYRTANECQNEDLFYALRGGGGGTFGVVMEATTLASPQVTLQAVLLSWKARDSTLTDELFTILTDNGLAWAEQGWGGFATSQIAIYINPLDTLDTATASKQMDPLIKFGEKLKENGVQGTSLVVTKFPSWGAFFHAFTAGNVAAVGNSLAIASRLVHKSNFADAESKLALKNALLESSSKTPSMIILMGPPTMYKDDGKTSVTSAWRDSVYHVTAISPWNWDATTDEKRAHYKEASDAIEPLRKITPDAAYQNEADVYEPNHEVSFWGDHYPELLKIKQKYDPDHLLDCWQCVGWDPKSPRFSCYL